MYHYMFANTQNCFYVSLLLLLFHQHVNELFVSTSQSPLLERLVPIRWLTSNNDVISQFEDLKIRRLYPLILSSQIPITFQYFQLSRLINCSFNFYSVHNRRKMLRLYYVWRISESNRWPPACKAGALASWANPPSFSSGPAWTSLGFARDELLST